MSDLIDRQAIHNTVIARYPDSDATQYSVGYADAINDVLKDIRYMPSAEPETANEKEKRDLELWNAITTAIHLCGLNGEDVTAMSLETLRQLGRYDLLPPCER